MYINLDGGISSVLSRFNECANSIANWFMFNDLLLNPSKSEVLITGTRQQIKTCSTVAVNISNETVPQSNCIKLLGVKLDNVLSFNQHISEVCPNAAFHLRALRHIRKQLDKSTANTIACSYVASRLD